MADLDHQYIASLAEYAKMGDSDAFAELYMATCQKQYRFASGYLKDEGLARDAVRDTYVYALRNIAALKDTQLFLSWLNQITFRICLRLEKKKQTLPENWPSGIAKSRSSSLWRIWNRRNP